MRRGCRARKRELRGRARQLNSRRGSRRRRRAGRGAHLRRQSTRCRVDSHKLTMRACTSTSRAPSVVVARGRAGRRGADENEEGGAARKLRVASCVMIEDVDRVHRVGESFPYKPAQLSGQGSSHGWSRRGAGSLVAWPVSSCCSAVAVYLAIVYACRAQPSSARACQGQPSCSFSVLAPSLSPTARARQRE